MLILLVILVLDVVRHSEN